MTATNRNLFLSRLTRSMAAETLGHQSDRQLVEQLLAERDDAAFETVVRRHGFMVYRVCRRILEREQDAEDAFQATFLVLAKNLHTVRKYSSLASWLHGVAHRVAIKSKAQAAIRRRHERSAVNRNVPRDADSWPKMCAVLDTELAKLPEKWRQPLILCYLEGCTQDEASRQLGCSKNTLRRRLEAARTALAQRLIRRGLAWQAAFTALLFTDCAHSAIIPSKLVFMAVEGASAVSDGRPIPAKYAVLTEGAMKSMMTWQLKCVSVLFLVFMAMGVGVRLPAHQKTADDPIAEREPCPPAKPTKPSAQTVTVHPKLTEVLERALKETSELVDPMRRVLAFRFIAEAQAGAGLRQDALATLQMALDAEFREKGDIGKMPKDNRLWLIAECRAKLGDIKSALETVELVSELNYTVALGEVAAAFARAGDVKNALETVNLLQGEKADKARDEALKFIAEAQVRAGDIKSAVKTADRIGADTSARVWSVAAIAVGEFKAGNREAAIQHLELLTKPQNGPFATAKVAEAQTLMGMVDAAEKTVSAMEPGKLRDYARLRMASSLAARGDIEKARNNAGVITDSIMKGEAQLEIVLALIRAKELPSAVDVAGHIDNGRLHCDALVEVAKAQAAAKGMDTAKKTLDEAYRLADLLEDEAQRSSVREFALSSVIGARAATGDLPGSLEAADKQVDSWVRTLAYIRVAEALAMKPRK